MWIAKQETKKEGKSSHMAAQSSIRHVPQQLVQQLDVLLIA